ALSNWESVSSGHEFLTEETYHDVGCVCDAMPFLIREIFESPNIVGFRPRFVPKLFTQDFLERDFGNLRQRCGGTSNPTVQALAYILRTMNCNRLSKFGNRSV